MAILKIKDNNGIWHIIRALKGKDGINLEFDWNGTKLGVKTSEEKEFKYVDLKGETGQTGSQGATGNGIQNIEKVSTVENVDTYAIHYTDGTQTTFDVTNGEVTKEQLDEVDNRAKNTRNELERVKNDILETGTASDSFINIQDSAWAELQEIKVDGVLSQETTNGYQLFDVSKVTTISNGTIENEIVTSNVLSGNGQGVTYNFPSITLTANTTYYIFTDIRIKSGTGSVNGINNGVVGWEKVSFPSLSNNYNTFISKYTPTENEKIYAVYLGFRNANDLIINVKNVMITTDRNATYEPYTGGQPSPSPDYSQEIETITGNFSLTSCNKNIFDFGKLKKDNSMSEISGNSVDFTIKTNDATCLLKFPIPIDNLYINFKISSNKMNGSIKVIYEDDTLDTIYERYDNLVISDVNVSKLFNKSKKIKGIRILSFGKITYFQIKEMLLAISSKEESFVEHLESTVNINLPSDEFIGKLDETYKDELVAVYNQEEEQYHLMLNKMIGKKVVDGNTGNIAKIGDNCFGINDAIKNFLHFSDLTIDNNKNSKYVTLAQTSSNSQFFSISKDYNYAMNFTSAEKFNNIRIKDIRLNTTDELKQSLNENPMEVYYILNLKSRYSLDLGPIDMLKTYEDVTNIFTDSDLLPSIRIKYYKNFKETIKDLKINEKSLKDELQSLNERLKALETKQVVSSDDSNVENGVIS